MLNFRVLDRKALVAFFDFFFHLGGKGIASKLASGTGAVGENEKERRSNKRNERRRRLVIARRALQKLRVVLCQSWRVEGRERVREGSDAKDVKVVVNS